MDLSSIRHFYLPQKFLDFLNIDMLGFNLIDWWLAYHFVVVGISYFILRKLKIKKKRSFWITLGLMVGVEIFERILTIQSLIIPEPWINSLLDIAVGLLAIWIIDKKIIK